jgi:ABC-type antimicrobial peptide transport system permease subunit
MLRYDGNPATLEATVRHEIAALDPNLAIFDTRTMQQHLHDAFFLPRLAGTLFGIFGIVGLILAAVGLYGVISYSITRRTREIGIRMALGAQIGNVQRLIVRQGMLLAGIAVLIGLPAALAVAKFSASFLYGIHPYDQPTFIAVPLFLAGVALIACYLPARRASRVNPQIALRHE